MSRAARIFVFLTALLALLFTACPQAGPEAEAGLDPAYRAELETWRAEREAKLRRPHGWLSLAGLHWLREGEQDFGREEGLPIRLPEPYGPLVAGTILVNGESVSVRPAPDSGLRIDGRELTEPIEIDTSAEGDRHILTLGELLFYVIRRGDRFAVRVKDPHNPARVNFEGLRWFEPDENLRIAASWEPFAEPRRLSVPNVTGGVSDAWAPGRVVFKVMGQEYSVLPAQESPDDPDESLFFVFGDKTNGVESYGSGRFLSADPPMNGTVILDFNKATSPPCLFTPYATCPLPIPENRLKVRIAAGEKAVGHPAH